MRPRETILISQTTGKKYYFQSTHDADRFLNRMQSYVTTRVASNHRVSHKDTHEEFRVIIKGDKNPSKNHGKQFMQPCWFCKKSINGCTWSKKGQPVDGWVAEQTSLKLSTSQTVPSYRILQCPEFEQE